MSALRLIATVSRPRFRARRCGGLSLALYEKATLKDGGIEQTKFDSYTPLRIAISVIANGEHATGVGEPAVTVIAPAIGNAVFNPVGAHVRSLPITADAVKAAMKASAQSASGAALRRFTVKLRV
jgi:hypothetical protein